MAHTFGKKRNAAAVFIGIRRDLLEASLFWDNGLLWFEILIAADETTAWATLRRLAIHLEVFELFNCI